MKAFIGKIGTNHYVVFATPAAERESWSHLAVGTLFSSDNEVINVVERAYMDNPNGYTQSFDDQCKFIRRDMRELLNSGGY